MVWRLPSCDGSSAHTLLCVTAMKHNYYWDLKADN